ncbi:MAG: DUF2911 domain-containing protein [Gemmatimonadales bacterium]
MKLIVVLLVIALAAAFVVTGTSLLPTAIALGPCLRDWTSAVSYQHRASPLATLRFRVGDVDALLCYGRPSLRDRTAFGALVPYDSLWRLGANEPTRLSVNGPVQLGSLRLAPGRYSLYALPRPEHWMIFVTRSTRHWGNDLSAAVRSQELGGIDVSVLSLAEPVESLTAAWQGADNGGTLTFSWERTAVAIPFSGTPE